MPQGDTPAVASEVSAQSRHARSSSPPPNVTLNDFDLLDRFTGRSLGKGSFGLVRMVRLKGTDNVFALKESAKKESVSGNLMAQVERELNNHHSLKHKNIVRLYNYMQDEKLVYMLLEFCAKGELYQLLRTQPYRRFDEAMSRHFFTQLVDGLQYLHSQNIIHRDLKPENLLVDADDVLKIADFGWCVRVRTEPVQRQFTFCGTMDYLAPEMLQQCGHDHTLDIWACGILLYEMMVGRPPFQTSNYPVLVSRILNVVLNFPAWMPEGVKDLVKKLMKPEPRHRLPLDQVLRHPWVLGLEYSELQNEPLRSQILMQPIDSRQSQGSTTIPSESPHGTSTGRTLDSRNSLNSTTHPVDSQQSQASTQPVDTRQNQYSTYFPCAARAPQQVPFATPTQSNRAVYVQSQQPPSYGQPVQRPLQIVHMMPFPQPGYPQRHVRAQEPRTWGGPVYRPA